MKAFLTITIAILGTLFLSGQTAQKLGNRADQDIQLCKNLGGGSERCLTIDSSTTTTLDATVVNQTSTGTPRNTISSPAANASWYQLGDGTNTVYFGRESDSGGTIFAGSGGDDVVIGTTTSEPVTIWTNNAKRVEIGSDGGVDLGPGASSGPDFHNIDGGDITLRSGNRLFMNNASNTVTGVQLDGDGDSYINGGDLGLGTNAPFKNTSKWPGDVLDVKGTIAAQDTSGTTTRQIGMMILHTENLSSATETSTFGAPGNTSQIIGIIIVNMNSNSSLVAIVRADSNGAPANVNYLMRDGNLVSATVVQSGTDNWKITGMSSNSNTISIAWIGMASAS